MKRFRITNRVLAAISMICLAYLCAPDDVVAQADSVSLVAGRPLRGTVESYTTDNIVVNTAEGKKNVQPWNVRLIRFEGSNELVRAKSAYYDDRFSACLKEIQNMTETPDREVIKHEVDYYRAAAATKVALQGGNVSADQAAGFVSQFIQDYPQSYHFFEAVDALGDLAVVLGRFDAAITQFDKTTASPWPDISFYGTLKSGKARLYAGQYAEAIESFKATENDDNVEDYAIQAKLIAKCLRAQALGMSGEAVAGEKLALEVIENENSKNIELFAYAYNALGTCYAKEQKTREAIRAFLKTDLLFTIDPDSHAQALYNLVDLWGKDDRPDRASRARQKLTERYRNTYWASKIQ